MKLFISLISILIIFNSSSQENSIDAEYLYFEALELHRLSTQSNSAENESEITAIKKLLKDESTYAAKRDFTNWSSCWADSDEAVFTYTRADGTVSRYGFNNIARPFKNAKPFLPEINCKNYYFLIGENIAFVSYDQSDNWGEEPGETKKQTRTLIKTNGQWKILHKNMIVVSSFTSNDLNSKSDKNEKDKAAIIKLLMDESTYIANQDFTNWSSCWVQSDEALFTYRNATSTVARYGFHNIAGAFKNQTPFKPEIKCNNYHILIGKNIAAAIYDQTANWGGNAGEESKQARILKKTDGQWKILHKDVVAVSSFNN